MLAVMGDESAAAPAEHGPTEDELMRERLITLAEV